MPSFWTSKMWKQHTSLSGTPFRIIYQKTQRLVWFKPCRDQDPQREKARYPPSLPLWHSVYYQERRSEEHRQRRSAQNAWNASFLSERSSCEIQRYADKNDMNNFSSSLNEFYGPTSASSSPLLSADGTNLISENKILETWVEHFDGVLNRPSSINDKAIERRLQVPMNESLDVTPTLEEVQMAIRQLSNGKALGSDSISAKINKEDGSALMGKLLTLIQVI